MPQDRRSLLAADMEGFEARVEIPSWRRKLRVAIYRRRVQHESPKNFQLELLDLDGGHWESAITSNEPLGLKTAWKFMAAPRA